MFNRDYGTTRLQDHGTTDTATARRGQPPSPGYGVPGWSVVSRLRGATARQGSQWLSRETAFTLANQRDRESIRGFTLTELLVTMSVLVLLVLLFTQLLNSAATTMTLGNKRMDVDSQARQLLDRMAIDFDQMLKRTDVDYFAKGTAPPNSLGGPMNGNDQISFYSTVPGYYPSSGSQSPLSLVAYRVNNASPAKNKLERLGKGLVWNGVSTGDTPVVLLPLTISATWLYATNQDPDPSSPSAYEAIGPDVFRFEYYYLLKSQPNPAPLATPYPAIFTDTPWDTRAGVAHTSVSGMRDVAAIVVATAVIDPKSKVLFTDPDSDIAALAGQLTDYNSASFPGPGQLLTNWRSTIDANPSLPRPAISGIRLYERYFYLYQ